MKRILAFSLLIIVVILVADLMAFKKLYYVKPTPANIVTSERYENLPIVTSNNITTTGGTTTMGYSWTPNEDSQYVAVVDHGVVTGYTSKPKCLCDFPWDPVKQACVAKIQFTTPKPVICTPITKKNQTQICSYKP